VTRTVNVDDAALGELPRIWPLEMRPKPGGGDPPTIENEYGGVPPAAVID
jgi:hypothetical protein